MLVISLKANKKRLVVLAVITVVLMILAISVFGGAKQVADTSAISYKAGNNEQRLAFLSQFGWKVEEDPVSVEEVIIPINFNKIYESYNELQKSQDLDLTKYAGETAKKWTYQVKNYPGYGEDSDCIRANLLVFEGVIIGGDISNIEQDGFMRTFDFPEQGEQLVE